MAKAKKIGSLYALLTLKSTRFGKAVKTIRLRLRRLGKSFARVGTRVLKFSAAMATAAAVGLAALVKRQMAAIDALGHTSDKLGITTEALAGLQAAAELTGVSAKTMELGLQRMTRRIAEAAHGTGEAKDAIAELGLDARKLGAMSPDKQFKAIADAMEKVGAQGDRVRLGFKLFDSEGVALINTLRGGTKALSAMQKMAIEAGVAINKFDVRKIQALEDAFTKIKLGIQGFVTQFTLHIAPVLDMVFGKLFKKNAGLAGAVVGEIFVEIFRNLKLAIASVMRAFIQVEIFALKIKSTFTSIWSSDSARKTRKEIAELNESLKKWSADVINDKFDKALEDYQRKLLEAKGPKPVMGPPEPPKTSSAIGQIADIVKRNPFASPILAGSHAATLATFKQSPNARAAQNKALQLGVSIENLIKLVERHTRRLAAGPQVGQLTIPR